MEKREEIIKNPPEDIIWYDNQWNRPKDYKYPHGAPVHWEYSNPKSKWGNYDGVSVTQRLNLFHNALIKTYLAAKERGLEVLLDYFNKAYMGYCMDGRSNTVIDYAKKLEHDNDPRLDFSNLPKLGAFVGAPCAYDNIVQFVAKELGNLKKDVTRKNAEEFLNGILKRIKTKDGPLKPEDVKACLDYAEKNYLIIFD